MRIAINTLSLKSTKVGMGNYITLLVKSLQSIDQDNEYYIFVSEKNTSFFDIKTSNFKKINLGKNVTNGLFRLVWEQLFFRRHIKKNKIDVLHSPGFVIPFFSKAKNIVTIADATFMTHPWVHTWVKRIYFGIMIPQSIKKADKVIAISESTKKDVLDLIKINPEKIRVTHLAHAKLFKPMKKSVAADYLKKKYNVDTPFLLSVGMIEPRKNLERTILAFAELKEEGIRHKLIIVGKKGWMYEGIFDIVKRKGLEKDVVFTGFVPDENLVRFYNCADVFIYPCLYEGFGIPILEAMACGCPVITSDISSMPEVAGDAALLVDPKRTADIISSIRKAINDKGLRKRLQKKGIARSSKFSWENTAKQTLKVYEEVGKKRSKN